jgi:hypothetical protein
MYARLLPNIAASAMHTVCLVRPLASLHAGENYANTFKAEVWFNFCAGLPLFRSGAQVATFAVVVSILLQ